MIEGDPKSKPHGKTSIRKQEKKKRGRPLKKKAKAYTLKNASRSDGKNFFMAYLRKGKKDRNKKGKK